MKLHRATSEAVIRSLQQIFEENRYADKVIERALRQNPRWGARDRRFIAETTYDIVRWRRWFCELADTHDGAYWKLLAVWCILRDVALPAWEEFADVSVSRVRERAAATTFPRKVRQSVPDWLDELGEAGLGKDKWERELSALNEEAKVVLRANTLKIEKPALRQLLQERGVLTHELKDFPDALVLDTRQNVFVTSEFSQGLFEVQDAASQMIAPFLDPAPGMRVIDACAGAGGKTLHLAALMKNKGRIIAMDTERWKLDELQKRAKRAGVSNIEVRPIESGKTIKRLAGSADRLLLDVPCSGLGVIKRNPDAKWKLSAEFIGKVRDLQRHILLDYSRMVKPGGLMVYSTCSILPSENEQQVGRFLDSVKGSFDLIAQKHIDPSAGFDGFYMALIRRNSGDVPQSTS